MLLRSIQLPIHGAITSARFQFWFYQGRRTSADSALLRADSTHLTTDGE